MDPVDARTVKQRTTSERDDESYKGRVTLKLVCVKLALSALWEYVLYARLVTRNQSLSEFSIDHLIRGRNLEKYRRPSK